MRKIAVDFCPPGLRKIPGSPASSECHVDTPPYSTAIQQAARKGVVTKNWIGTGVSQHELEFSLNAHDHDAMTSAHDLCPIHPLLDRQQSLQFSLQFHCHSCSPRSYEIIAKQKNAENCGKIADRIYPPPCYKQQRTGAGAKLSANSNRIG